MSTRRFTGVVRRAAADVLNVGAAIVVGMIRAAGVLLPVSLLVPAPAFLALRRWRRRPFASV